MRLTDIRVRSLPAPEKGAKIYYDDILRGFGVRVSQGGTKAFILATGKTRDRVTLGRYPLISLQEARRAAQERLAEQTLGKARAPRIRLSGALETYYAKHLAERCGERTQREIKRLFKRYLKPDAPLEQVNTHTLTKILDDISSPSEKEHFFRAAKTFFKWCAKRQLITQNPIETLDTPAKGKSRERVLSDDELRAVWKAADSTGYPFGHICKVLILTGMRRSEASKLTVDYFKEDTICLPAEIVKNKRSHTFPIGRNARSLFTEKEIPAQGFIFPARGKTNSSFNGFSKAKMCLDKEVAKLFPVGPWVLHDLRRTYATNLQRLGIKLEVIEALLNHVSGTRSGIVGVYQRHTFWDEMISAVGKYEAWFTSLTGENSEV